MSKKELTINENNNDLYIPPTKTPQSDVFTGNNDPDIMLVELNREDRLFLQMLRQNKGLLIPVDKANGTTSKERGCSGCSNCIIF